MKVNSEDRNPALVSLYKNPNQIITMDANFIIPPYRKQMKRDIPFSLFCTCWLNPIFNTFPNLAIHEAVHNELVSRPIRSFVDDKYQSRPPKIIIHRDSQLTEIEHGLRNTFEAKIYPYTQYNPQFDNRDDRGEVKTLAYVAVKGLLYFASHDYDAIQLIENAESWGTGLGDIQVIKMYELIYFLSEKYPNLKKPLKMLYKVQYFLTDREKTKNPNWGEFSKSMKSVYQFKF